MWSELPWIWRLPGNGKKRSKTFQKERFGSKGTEDGSTWSLYPPATIDCSQIQPRFTRCTLTASEQPIDRLSSGELLQNWLLFELLRVSFSFDELLAVPSSTLEPSLKFHWILLSSFEISRISLDFIGFHSAQRFRRLANVTRRTQGKNRREVDRASNRKSI